MRVDRLVGARAMDQNVKKKIRPGTIELAPDECSIVVHYESETSYLDGEGGVVRVDRKPNMKRIRVKSLSERSNIESLAREVVDKCRLISESRLPLVERLLHQLRQRDFDSAVGARGLAAGGR